MNSIEGDSDAEDEEWTPAREQAGTSSRKRARVPSASAWQRKKNMKRKGQPRRARYNHAGDTTVHHLYSLFRSKKPENAIALLRLLVDRHIKGLEQRHKNKLFRAKKLVLDVLRARFLEMEKTEACSVTLPVATGSNFLSAEFSSAFPEIVQENILAPSLTELNQEAVTLSSEPQTMNIQRMILEQEQMLPCAETEIDSQMSTVLVGESSSTVQAPTSNVNVSQLQVSGDNSEEPMMQESPICESPLAESPGAQTDMSRFALSSTQSTSRTTTPDLISFGDRVSEQGSLVNSSGSSENSEEVKIDGAYIFVKLFTFLTPETDNVVKRKSYQGLHLDSSDLSSSSDDSDSLEDDEIAGRADKVSYDEWELDEEKIRNLKTEELLRKVLFKLDDRMLRKSPDMAYLKFYILQCVIELGDINILHTLFNNETLPHHPDLDEVSALDYAVLVNQTVMIEDLISRGLEHLKYLAKWGDVSEWSRVSRESFIAIQSAHDKLRGIVNTAIQEEVWFNNEYTIEGPLLVVQHGKMKEIRFSWPDCRIYQGVWTLVVYHMKYEKFTSKIVERSEWETKEERGMFGEKVTWNGQVLHKLHPARKTNACCYVFSDADRYRVNYAVETDGKENVVVPSFHMHPDHFMSTPPPTLLSSVHLLNRLETDSLAIHKALFLEQRTCERLGVADAEARKKRMAQVLECVLPTFLQKKPLYYLTDVYHGCTLMHMAVHLKDERILGILIKYRLPIDERDTEGLTPIEVAGRYGFLRAIMHFIDFGANYCNFFEQSSGSQRISDQIADSVKYFAEIKHSVREKKIKDYLRNMPWFTATTEFEGPLLFMQTTRSQELRFRLQELPSKNHRYSLILLLISKTPEPNEILKIIEGTFGPPALEFNGTACGGDGLRYSIIPWKGQNAVRMPAGYFQDYAGAYNYWALQIIKDPLDHQE